MATGRDPERKARRGRPAKLTRAQILEAGLDLVGRAGRDALSMRALAKALGTGTMSLYGHVRDRADLIDGLAARALDQVDVGLDKPGTWQERITRWMFSIRRRMLAHPAVWPLFMKQRWGSPQQLRAARVAVEVLTGAGFETRVATEAAQGLLWAVFGFVLLETGGRQGPRSASPRQQLAAALLSLPEAERVKTKPLLPYLATRNFDRLFASTVRRLVAGLITELGET